MGFFKSTYSVGADVIRGANEYFRPGADTYIIRKPFTVAAFSRCDFEAGRVRLDFKVARCPRR